MQTKTAHPKGLAAIQIDGSEYHVNKYGVVLQAPQPDKHLAGWNTIKGAPADVRNAVHEIIRPAFVRWDRSDRVYDLRQMRRIFDQQ